MKRSSKLLAIVSCQLLDRSSQMVILLLTPWSSMASGGSTASVRFTWLCSRD